MWSLDPNYPNPSPIPYSLCDLGPVTEPFSVSSSYVVIVIMQCSFGELWWRLSQYVKFWGECLGHSRTFLWQLTFVCLLCVLIQLMSVSTAEQALILFLFYRGRRWKHLAQSHSASGRAGTWPRLFTWECRLTPTTLSQLNIKFLGRHVGSTGVSCCLLWWWWHFPGL